MDQTPKNLAGVYTTLSTFRDHYLQCARDNAKLTIPSLVPEDEFLTKTSGRKLEQPDNPIGARGTNNLAAKLLVSMLPANAPVFRLVINDITVKKQMAALPKKGTTDIQKALAEVERSGMQEIDSTGVRGPAYIMLQHLLVAGNYLFYSDPTTGECRGYPIYAYVCERDRSGNWLRIVIKEQVAYVTLTPEQQETYRAEKQIKDGDEFDKNSCQVDVYTCVERTESKRFREWQELCGKVVEGSVGVYSEETCPWMPLRMIPVDGDDYGRAFVSDCYGDLYNANELRKAIVLWSRAASKVVYLVKPNATTKVDKLTKAKSGDFVSGNPDDVVALQIEKTQDFNVAQAVLQQIERALEQSFLLNSTVQRDAERVTAEEVKAVIAELNTGLGGIMALLTNEFQLRYVRLLLARMQKQKMFKLPKGIVKPAIVTGIAALGRGQDLANLLSAINALASMNTIPEELRARIKPTDFLNRVFAAAGADPDGLFMDDEEFEAYQQERMLQQTMMNAAPGVAQKLAGAAADQMAGDGAEEAATSEEAPAE